jgi:hypothetical protein
MLYLRFTAFDPKQTFTLLVAYACVSFGQQLAWVRRQYCSPMAA